MKLNFCIMLFVLNLAILFSQNFELNGRIKQLSGLSYEINLIKDFSFDSEEIIFRDYDLGSTENDYIIKNHKYSYSEQDNLTFLELEKNERFLCLANKDLCILYSGVESEPIYIGSNFIEFFGFPKKNGFIASSELKEGNKIYSSVDLCNINLDSPWVEAADDYGIGEYVIFNANCTYIYFLNGYVSFQKPYLYTANSRVKKIKITFIDEENKLPIIFSINDTPNPQKLDLGFRCITRIKMEIIDVYKGDKYQDTCINGLIFRIY